MKLIKELLFSDNDFKSILDNTRTKGSYSTMQFVLRLRSDIRKGLGEMEDSPERIQATSTSIHENIHWWQHIGSNFGFLYSLSYPSLVHIIRDTLKSEDLAFKPLVKLDQIIYEKTGNAGNRKLNFILNNYYDLHYAKSFALDNLNIYEIQKDRRFFLNMGHCYHMLWDITIASVATIVDQQDNLFLPRRNKWSKEFNFLKENKVSGFFVDSKMHITPIGIKAIFEGQAVFNQMQFLAVNLNQYLTFEDVEKVGMLHGIYKEAFHLFLEIINLERPQFLLDSIVGLFLLICDISINPNNGFPLDIYDYEGFISKNDPAMRFVSLCKFISNNPQKYIEKISTYSKDEYISLSKELSEGIKCKCSYEGIKEVLSWRSRAEVKKLLEEEKDGNYSLENLSIRLLVSKFIRFQEDKYEHPNLFCWIGIHANSENPDIDFSTVNKLYLKHHALYTDGADGEIKPVIFDGWNEEQTYRTFNYFYSLNIMYNIAIEWIEKDGEFSYDYKWLLNKDKEEIIPTIKNNFMKNFKVTLDNIKVL